MKVKKMLYGEIKEIHFFFINFIKDKQKDFFPMGKLFIFS